MSIYGPLTSDRFAYELCVEERFEVLRPMSSEQVKNFAQDFSPSCRPAQTTARMVALQCLVEVLAARLQAELAIREVREQEAERQRAELDTLRAIADAREEDDEASPASQELYQEARKAMLYGGVRSDPATDDLEAMTAGDVALSIPAGAAERFEVAQKRLSDLEMAQAAKGARL